MSPRPILSPAHWSPAPPWLAAPHPVTTLADAWDLHRDDADLMASCLGEPSWAEVHQRGWTERRLAFADWWRRVTGDPSSAPWLAGGAGQVEELRHPSYGWRWQCRATLLVALPAAAHVAHAALLMERRGRLRPELAAASSVVWAQGDVRRG